MKTLLPFLITFVWVSVAHGQEYLKGTKELSQHAEGVMNDFEKAEYTTAFDALRAYWPIPENEVDQLESQTIKQFNVAIDRFGAVMGYDFIKEQTINDFVIRKIYVIRFEKHMIRFLFTYYKSDKGWILNAFKWDDQYEELLEDN